MPDDRSHRQRPGDPSAGHPEIRPGDCLGRYTIRDLIGAGGMGRVFAALDPELGRTVALKVIRRDRLRTPSLAQARLRREAQVLARLQHPGVVTVYDVGTQDDQVFIAMELVTGATLRGWLGAARRSWRAILATFVAAGRGLAAAHTVGIVHRDFKPENVIVGDHRVVVVDFGLARAGDDGPADTEVSPLEGPDRLTLGLTLTGEHLGTPRYMAPEQRSGGVVTAKADQFAFCVALKEALHGEAAQAGAARRPEIPGWVDAAVDRGLEADPAARWPSMDDLLAALGRDPAARRRRIVAGAVGTALFAAAIWSLAFPHAGDPCAGRAARLAGVWDAARQDAVGAAFAAAGVRYGDDTWRRVRSSIDDYAARWADMTVDSCRATRVDGRQSDTLLDLRTACLERRRAVLGALTGLWARGMSAETVEHAPDAVRDLEAISECADVRALTERAPPPADPVHAELVASARTGLDALRALALAHRLPEAKKAAALVRAQSEATGWAPIRAEAAYIEGDILGDLGDPGAEASLLESARQAGAARDDRLEARALVRLVRHTAVNQQSAGRALLIADVADGVVARADDPAERVHLLRGRGLALLTSGKNEAARTTFIAARALATSVFGAGDRETLAIASNLVQVVSALGDWAGAVRLGEQNLAATIALLGPDHPQVVQVLNGIAIAAADGGDQETAADSFRRALAINERVSGPDSAATAVTLNNLGAVERTRGHLDEAQGLLERALAIRERVLGPEHSYVASTLGNLADVRARQGHLGEALELDRRTLAIITKVHGPMHARVATAQHKLGEVLEETGDAAGALDAYQRSLDIRKQVLGADHPMTLYSMMLVGRALMLLHRCAEARPLLTAAATGLEKTVGPEHPDFVESLAAQAACDLADGQAARAVDRLERAVAVAEKRHLGTGERERNRFLLARALWSLGRRDAAIAAAAKAEAALESSADGARDRAAAHAWLATRR